MQPEGELTPDIFTKAALLSETTQRTDRRHNMGEPS
jgi:hypothetical protein